MRSKARCPTSQFHSSNSLISFCCFPRKFSVALNNKLALYWSYAFLPCCQDRMSQLFVSYLASSVPVGRIELHSQLIRFPSLQPFLFFPIVCDGLSFSLHFLFPLILYLVLNSQGWCWISPTFPFPSPLSFFQCGLITLQTSPGIILVFSLTIHLRLFRSHVLILAFFISMKSFCRGALFLLGDS